MPRMGCHNAGRSPCDNVTSYASWLSSFCHLSQIRPGYPAPVRPYMEGVCQLMSLVSVSAKAGFRGGAGSAAPTGSLADACLSLRPFPCVCVVRLGWRAKHFPALLNHSHPQLRNHRLSHSRSRFRRHPTPTAAFAHLRSAVQLAWQHGNVPAHTRDAQWEQRLSFSDTVWFPSRGDSLPCGSSAITYCQILPAKDAAGPWRNCRRDLWAGCLLPSRSCVLPPNKRV